MKTTLPEYLHYCQFAKRWIVAETPKKCCNTYDCESCEYYEKRLLNRYIKRKLRKLEKDNLSRKI